MNRYLVAIKREVMSWLNPEAFGDVLKEFDSMEAAKEYINLKPKFVRNKLHIVVK